MLPLDVVGAIELAYDRTKDDAAWLENLTQKIAPAFSDGQATTAFFFDIVGDNGHLGQTASTGSKPYGRTNYQKVHEVGGQVIPARVAYECDMFTLLSRAVGAEVAKKALRGGGIDTDDSLGLRANMTAESGILVTTPVRAGYRIKDRHLWTRFAAHVGCALRLRRHQSAPSPDSAQAVLSPRGKLEHGAATAVAARDKLADAARDIDRARGKLRRIDPDGASSLWRAMVRGEWSLVEWIDHDGKRFLLAQENAIPGSAPRVLTTRERQVVACAAMGHSNKLIAYDLGLSAGTVGAILARATKKVGVSGRVALIRAFRDGRT